MDKAFIKGLRMLEALSLSKQLRGVTELANELELTKSNVHRLLSTLQRMGYVQKIQSASTYELTMKTWELGSQVADRLDFVTIARPVMKELAERTGEGVHLSVLNGTEVIYLEKIESAPHTSIGSPAPAYTVATGKAMLAQLPNVYLDQFAPHLHRYTATTRTTLKELRADVDLVRQQGYSAVGHGEWREGIAACACAILGRSSKLVGAIGVSGPDQRIDRELITQFSVYVMDAARSISIAMGYQDRAGG